MYFTELEVFVMLFPKFLSLACAQVPEVLSGVASEQFIGRHRFSLPQNSSGSYHRSTADLNTYSDVCIRSDEGKVADFTGVKDGV